MVVQHVFMFHWNMKTRCEHQLVFLRAIVVAVATCSHERSAIESRMRRCNAHGDARCLSTASSPRAAGIATSHPQKGEISLITLASLIAPTLGRRSLKMAVQADQIDESAPEGSPTVAVPAWIRAPYQRPGASSKK